ncbi:MAG: hypothetical protein HKN68_01445 [Saprospiraceae bacterium]|nr:hypothetical protein [Saprospiraceae bacterium]
MVEEVHESYTSGPIVSDNFFAINSRTEVTFKGIGRTSLNEISLYEVKEGKIVREQFFCTPMTPRA